MVVTSQYMVVNRKQSPKCIKNWRHKPCRISKSIFIYINCKSSSPGASGLLQHTDSESTRDSGHTGSTLIAVCLVWLCCGRICCSSSYCQWSCSSTGELRPRLWHRNNRQLQLLLHANRKPGTQCRLSARPAELARPRVPYAGRRPHRRTIAGGWCHGLQPETSRMASVGRQTDVV